LIVFLKTSEECNSVGFTYIEPSNTISSVSQAFNTGSETHRITVSGSGFDSSC